MPIATIVIQATFPLSCLMTAGFLGFLILLTTLPNVAISSTFSLGNIPQDLPLQVSASKFSVQVCVCVCVCVPMSTHECTCLSVQVHTYIHVYVYMWKPDIFIPVFFNHSSSYSLRQDLSLNEPGANWSH